MSDQSKPNRWSRNYKPDVAESKALPLPPPSNKQNDYKKDWTVEQAKGTENIDSRRQPPRLAGTETAKPFYAASPS